MRGRRAVLDSEKLVTSRRTALVMGALGLRPAQARVSCGHGPDLLSDQRACSVSPVWRLGMERS